MNAVYVTDRDLFYIKWSTPSNGGSPVDEIYFYLITPNETNYYWYESDETKFNYSDSICK